MKNITLLYSKNVLTGFLLFLALGCVNTDDYAKIHKPQYDHIVGKKFKESIYEAKNSFERVREVDGIVELMKTGRTDGCVLIFGVRKTDDVIQYWRVDSGAGTCLERKKSPGS
jgi:hypothetical protein